MACEKAISVVKVVLAPPHMPLTQNSPGSAETSQVADLIIDMNNGMGYVPSTTGVTYHT